MPRAKSSDARALHQHSGIPRTKLQARLAKLVNDAGGPIAFADKHDTSPEYVRQVLKWTTPTPAWLLEMIGIRRTRQVRYIYEEITTPAPVVGQACPAEREAR